MLSLVFAAALQLPVPFCWQFDAPTLTNRTYLADLDYLKANTEAELMLVGPVSGVAPEGNRLFHDALKELVAHAPEKYENLQVRVAGWNIRWNDIPKKEQDEYIRRVESIMK